MTASIIMESPNAQRYQSELVGGTGEKAITGLESYPQKCLDNARHQQWIPMISLHKTSLPDLFKSVSVKRLIQFKSKNIVRIARHHNSPHRLAESNFDSEKTLYGSGTFFHTDDLQVDRCPLPECTKIKEPHRAVVNIQVLTSPHVIFDNSEAASSVIDFFYDAQNRTNVIEAQGLRIKKYEKSSAPYCIIECASHDLSLLDKLKEHHNSCQRLLKQIRSHSSPPVKERLLVFMAHPHGLAKHFAFGTLKKKDKVANSTVSISENCQITQCSLRYLTPGCPGSGGGQLMEIGSDGSCLTFALHLGRDRNGERMSGLGWTAE